MNASVSKQVPFTFLTRNGQRRLRYRALLHLFLRGSNCPWTRLTYHELGFFLRLPSWHPSASSRGVKLPGGYFTATFPTGRILRGRGRKGVVTHHRLTDGSSITMGDVPYNWPGVANQRKLADSWLSINQHKTRFREKGAPRGAPQILIVDRIPIIREIYFPFNPYL